MGAIRGDKIIEKLQNVGFIVRSHSADRLRDGQVSVLHRVDADSAAHVAPSVHRAHGHRALQRRDPRLRGPVLRLRGPHGLRPADALLGAGPGERQRRRDRVRRGRHEGVRRLRHANAQPLLGQLPLARRHGVDVDELQRLPKVEHGADGRLDVRLREVRRNQRRSQDVDAVRNYRANSRAPKRVFISVLIKINYGPIKREAARMKIVLLPDVGRRKIVPDCDWRRTRQR